MSSRNKDTPSDRVAAAKAATAAANADAVAAVKARLEAAKQAKLKPAASTEKKVEAAPVAKKRNDDDDEGMDSLSLKDAKTLEIEAKALHVLKTLIQDVDEAVLRYLSGVLADEPTQDGLDFFESMCDFLIAYDAAENPAECERLCERIIEGLRANGVEGKPAKRVTQQLSEDDALIKAMEKESEVQDSEWVQADESHRSELRPGTKVMALYPVHKTLSPAIVMNAPANNSKFTLQFTEQGSQAEVELADIRIKPAKASEEVQVRLLSAPIRIADFGEEKVVKIVIQQSEEGPTKKMLKREAIERKKEELARKREEARKKRAEERKLEAMKLYLTTSASVRTANKEVHIRNFGMTTPDGGQELLANSDLQFINGRRYGLIGRNGVGKTTLMKMIANYEIANFPTYLRVVHVEQEVSGDDTPVLQYVLQSDIERELLLQEEKRLQAILNKEEGAQKDQKDAKESKGKEDEDPATRLEAVYNRMKEIDVWGAEARAAAILHGLQFSTERQQMPTKSLSGGWRMRVALACALFVQPDLLLLDEPTNHLDFPAVLWLEDYLNKYNKTLIVVSHDRQFVNNVITDVIHFHEKQLIYYRGDYDTFEKVRAEHLKQQKSAFEAQKLKKDHMQKFIDKFRYNANRAALVQSRIKAINRMETLMDVEDEHEFRLEFPEPDRIEGTIISCKDIYFGYDVNKQLLRNVSCHVDMDSRVGVLGANGVGKSTLLKVLLGELEPQAGEVYRNGHARIATFAQHHMDQLKPHLTPLELLMDLFPKNHPQLIRRHLGHFGITGDLALQRIQYLSGGQKSRVAFSIVAWKKPHLYVMDEPTNHLDLETIDALILAINQFGGGVLLVSHDQHFLASVCSEFWGVLEGKMKRFDSLDTAKKFTYSTIAGI